MYIYTYHIRGLIFSKKYFVYLSITILSPSKLSPSDIIHFPILEMQFSVPRTAPFSIFLLSPEWGQNAFLSSVAWVLERGKSQGWLSLVNTVVEAGLRLIFGQKLTLKHRCMSWCVIMVQNPWLLFPQFCAFLTNCCGIGHTTLWLEFIMHNVIAVKENSEQNIHILPKLPFSVLALLNAFIGGIGLWFQCYKHTPMICHQLWYFWANLDHCWTLAIFPLRYSSDIFFFLKLINFCCRMFHA